MKKILFLAAIIGAACFTANASPPFEKKSENVQLSELKNLPVCTIELQVVKPYDLQMPEVTVLENCEHRAEVFLPVFLNYQAATINAPKIYRVTGNSMARIRCSDANLLFRLNKQTRFVKIANHQKFQYSMASWQSKSFKK